MAQQEKQRTYYLDGRTYSEVCGKYGRWNVLFHPDISSEDYIHRKSILDLPIDIISDILSRLPIEDLIRCKSVCKALYSLTRESNFIELHTNRASSQQGCIILKLYERKLDDLYSLIDKQTCKRIPEKYFRPLNSDYRIRSSCNGLLCITPIRHDTVFIYNPVTRECKKLPSIIDADSFGSFGIGFDRISKRYKVVYVYNPFYIDANYHPYWTTRYSVGKIITVGEGSWRKLDVRYKVQVSQTVFLDEAFHWIIQNHGKTPISELILALDISTEKFRTINIPPVELPDHLYLIDSELFLAFAEQNKSLERPRIWQIMGSDNNGRRLYEYPCKNMFGTNVLVLGLLPNEAILYEATNISEGEEQNQLALYFVEKQQSCILKMYSKYHYFCVYFFVPTLQSPSTISYSKNLKNCSNAEIRERQERGRGKKRDERRNWSVSSSVSPSFSDEWSVSRSVSPSFSDEWIQRKGEAVMRKSKEDRKKRKDRKKRGTI